jgi:hypothetical protein
MSRRREYEDPIVDGDSSKKNFCFLTSEWGKYFVDAYFASTGGTND